MHHLRTSIEVPTGLNADLAFFTAAALRWSLPRFEGLNATVVVSLFIFSMWPRVSKASRQVVQVAAALCMLSWHLGRDESISITQAPNPDPCNFAFSNSSLFDSITASILVDTCCFVIMRATRGMCAVAAILCMLAATAAARCADARSSGANERIRITFSSLSWRRRLAVCPLIIFMGPRLSFPASAGFLAWLMVRISASAGPIPRGRCCKVSCFSAHHPPGVACCACASFALFRQPTVIDLPSSSNLFPCALCHVALRGLRYQALAVETCCI